MNFIYSGIIIILQINLIGGVLMKVLMINGSPHANGNTALALKEMQKKFSIYFKEVTEDDCV